MDFDMGTPRSASQELSSFLWLSLRPSRANDPPSLLTGTLLSPLSAPLQLVTPNGRSTEASQSPPGPRPVGFPPEAAPAHPQLLDRARLGRASRVSLKAQELPDARLSCGWPTLVDHAALLQVLMSLNTFLPVFQNAEKLRDITNFFLNVCFLPIKSAPHYFLIVKRKKPNETTENRGL